MPFRTRDVKKALERKFGFKVEPRSKHDWLAFYHNGKKVAMTGFSRRSGPTIDDDGLLKQMSREVGVSRLGFFKAMIACTKTLDDYIHELKEHGLIG